MELPDKFINIGTITERIPFIEPSIPLVHMPTRKQRARSRLDFLSPVSFEDLTRLRKQLLQTAPRGSHVISTVSVRQPIDGVVCMRVVGCDLNPEETDPYYGYDGGALILNAAPQPRSEVRFEFADPGEYVAELCLSTNNRNIIVKPFLRRPIAKPGLDIWMWHYDHYLMHMDQNRLVFRYRIEDCPRSPLKLQFLSFGQEVTLYWACFILLTSHRQFKGCLHE